MAVGRPKFSLALQPAAPCLQLPTSVQTLLAAMPRWRWYRTLALAMKTTGVKLRADWTLWSVQCLRARPPD